MKSKKPDQSVFTEAWQNMFADMGKFLPQKLRGGKKPWKLALVLLLIELVVFGTAGKFLYDWLTS